MKELMKAQREAARKKAQMQESVADVYDTNIRTFSKSITAVSYTHLVVYKRQIHNYPIKSIKFV